MRSSIAGLILFAAFVVGGCGGGGGSSDSESGNGVGDAGPDSRTTSLSLAPIEIIEGREFKWEVSIEAPVSPVVSIKWEQVSGVPVTILQGATATLVADAPFVAEPQSVEMRVRATDDRGRSVETVSVITVYPYVPTYLGLTPFVDLREGLLPYPTGTLSFSTALGEDLEVPSDAARPMLVMAHDANGTVLLSVANRDGGLLGEAEGVVEFSVDSTALALVVLVAGEAIPTLTKDRVAEIRALAEFADLAVAIESLLGADPNFLERVAHYPDLQALIALAANSLPPLPLPAGEEDLSWAAMGGDMATFSSTQVDQGFGEWKDGFYCTWLTGWPCSPWHADQAWNWFGTARGAETLLPQGFSDWAKLALPLWNAYYVADKYSELLSEAHLTPFLAYSWDKRSLHAFANPNYINYAMEGYSGAEQRFWRLTPRNSTMGKKLLNSGAASRTEAARASQQLSPEIDRIVFQRYRFSLNSQGDPVPDHAAVVSFFNLLGLAVSAANLVTDVSELYKVFEGIDAERSVNLLMCAAEFFAGEDLYLDPTLPGIEQATEFTVRYSSAVIRHVLFSSDCQEILLNGGKKLVAKLASAKINAAVDSALTVLTYGGKAAFDSANDFTPVATSFISPAARGVEYYIDWVEHEGKPHIHRVMTTQFPNAAFSVNQLTGPSIRLDASGSGHDPSTTLSYSWGLVADLSGSGYSYLGAGALLEYTFPAAGTYFVHLKVTDGYGLADIAKSAVIVEAGQPPVIESLSCNLQPGDLLQMKLGLSDPEQRATVIRWFDDLESTQADQTTAVDAREVVLGTTPVAGGNWARVEIDVADGETISRTCWTGRTPPPPLGTGRLNDTGIDWCADGGTNFLTCPVAGYPGQDGEFGRDAATRAGTLKKMGGGNAGFDYTKIANNGSKLPASATLGSGPNDWACTRDNVTGLIWEVKVDNPSHMRHQGHTYTWYDPNSPDGDPGTPNRGICTGSNCDTTGFVQAVNAQGLCGVSDWGMPTRRELQEIVDYGGHSPAIDTGYFPNTPSHWFWSGSPLAHEVNGQFPVWRVSFSLGDVDGGGGRSQYYRYPVRLVRGGK